MREMAGAELWLPRVLPPPPPGSPSLVGSEGLEGTAVLITCHCRASVNSRVLRGPERKPDAAPPSTCPRSGAAPSAPCWGPGPLVWLEEETSQGSWGIFVAPLNPCRVGMTASNLSVSMEFGFYCYFVIGYLGHFKPDPFGGTLNFGDLIKFQQVSFLLI